MWLVEGDIGERSGRLKIACVGIPLGDETFCEGNVHGDVGFLRAIEVDDGCFHANRAAEGGLEAAAAEVLDETGQIGLAGQELNGQPLDRLAIGAGDGCEGAPFVRGEAGNGERLATMARRGDGQRT